VQGPVGEPCQPLAVADRDATDEVRAAADPPTATRGPLERRLFRLAPALRTHLTLCVLAALMTAAAVLVVAESVGRYLPRLLDADHSVVGSLCAALVLGALLRGAAVALTELSSSRAVIGTRTALRDEVLDHVARVDPLQLPELGPARVSALVTSGMDALEPWIRSYLPALATAAVVPLATGLRILGADLISALILAAVVPLIPIFMVLIGRATEDRTARQWAVLQRLAGHFLDVLVGLPTLRLFGRASLQVERVREVTDQYRRAVMAQLRVAFLSALVLELLTTLSVAIIAVALGTRLINGSVTLGSALVVLLLAPECLLPLRRVGAAFHSAIAGVDAADEVDAVLRLPAIARAGDAAATPGSQGGPHGGALAAVGVAVTDPVRGERLAPLDLRVEPGELVALVGPSGVGKTTLLEVLRGRLAPTSGRVEVAGRDLEHLSVDEAVAVFAVVPQHPGAIAATVLDSVLLGVNGRQSAAAAQRELDALALGALAARPPTELSGGERQRVAIARAALRAELGGATVLLADEPTAHLDDASTAAAVDRLAALAADGAAVLVATHDPRVIRRADRVVELQGGAATGPTRPRRAAPTAAQVRAVLDRPSALPDPQPDLVGGTVAPVAIAEVDPDAPGPESRRPEIGSDDWLTPVASAQAPGPTVGTAAWLRRVARPFRWRFAGSFVLGGLAELCTVGLAGVAAWLIVRAAQQPSFEALALAAVAVRTFGIGRGVLRYVERLVSHDTTFRLLAEVRAQVVARLAVLSPAGLPRLARGELLARLVDDVDRLQDLFLRVMAPIAAALIATLAAVVVTAFLDPLAALVLAVAVVATALVLPLWSIRRARRDSLAFVAGKAQVAAGVVDLVEHVDELVANDAVGDWRRRIDVAAAQVDDLDRRRARAAALLTGTATAAAALTSAAMVAVVGSQIVGDSLPASAPVLGVLVLWPLAVLEVVAPLVNTGDPAATAIASADRVVEILERPDPDPEPTHAAPAPSSERRAGAALELDDVQLAWPGDRRGDAPPPVVLSHVDLGVAPGERVLLRGPSGAGKSTLAAALVRFVPPTAGEYLLDGEDTAALGGDQVRRRVTWCEQEPWFADTTLAANLRIAAPDADDDELWAALGRVQLEDWARRLPRELETMLGRDSVAASGGQRQRLALARVLLSTHDAVVLDEPTAHLDRVTADRVVAELLDALGERSALVITHEPLDLAARTLRVEDGRVRAE